MNPRFVIDPLRWSNSLLVPLLLLAAMSAQAGGLGIHSSRAGVGFGNLKEFAGLRSKTRNGSYTGVGLNLHGLAISSSIRTRSVRGIAVAAVYQRTDDLYGVATGLYNRADHAEGLMIGLFSHVASGPSAARWLPLINARF